MWRVVLALCLVVALALPALAEDAEPASQELQRGFEDGAWVDEYFGLVYKAPELKEGFGFGMGGQTVLWSGKCAGGVDVEIVAMEAPHELTATQWLEGLKKSFERDGKDRKEMSEGTEPRPWILYVQESLAGFQRHHGHAFYVRGPTCFQVHAQVREKSDTSTGAIEKALGGLTVDPDTVAFLGAHLAAKDAGGQPTDAAILIQTGLGYVGQRFRNPERALQAFELARAAAATTELTAEQKWSLEEGVGLALLTLGRHEESIPVWKQAIALAADTAEAAAGQSNSYYNLACAYSLLGRLDEAFAALTTSFELGVGRSVEQLKSHAEQDPDLANMRADERWSELKK